MHALARAQHGKLGLFLGLSVLVHALLMLPAGQPIVSLQVPAPELVLTTLGNPSVPRLPRRTSAPAPVTAPADVTQLSETRDDDARAAADTANHLRSLLHAALDQHFIYPAFARRQGWEGRVEVLVRLEQNGQLIALKIVRSSGYPILDEDALLTLRRIGAIPQAQTALKGYSSYDIRLPILYRLTEG